jgi:TP901 family phage tail tape measure protein
MLSNTMKMALMFTAIDATAGILRGLDNRILGLGKAAQKTRQDFESMVSHMQAGLKALAASWYIGKELEKGVKVSADMEESMSTLEMSMGRTRQNAAEFHEQLEKVRDVAAKVQLLFPMGQKEFVDAAVVLTQSGMKFKDLADEKGALYSVGALASIGKISTVQAAETISAGANIFEAHGAKLGKMADFMQRIGTTTPLHIGLQAEALHEAGPSAKGLGFSYEETLTAMGTYAKQTGDAAKAGTRFQEFGQRLLNSSKEEKKALKEAGISFYDLSGKLKPMVGIVEELQRFRAETKGKHPYFTEQEFNDLFKKIFQGRGEFMAYALSKTGEGSYQDVYKTQAESYDIQAKVNIALKDFNRNIEALVGSTKTLVADAFDPLLKSLTPVVQQINAVIGALDDFSKAHRELVKDVSGAVVALMAAGAVYGSYRLIRGIISFTRVLAGLSTAATAATAAAAPLEAGAVALAGGATMAASAVMALVAALAAATWWMHSSTMERYKKTGELPPSPDERPDIAKWEDPDEALIKAALGKSKAELQANRRYLLPPAPEAANVAKHDRPTVDAVVAGLHRLENHLQKQKPEVHVHLSVNVDQNGRATSVSHDPNAKIDLKRGRFMPQSFFEHD